PLRDRLIESKRAGRKLALKKVGSIDPYLTAKFDRLPAAQVRQILLEGVALQAEMRIERLADGAVRSERHRRESAIVRQGSQVRRQAQDVVGIDAEGVGLPVGEQPGEAVSGFGKQTRADVLSVIRGCCLPRTRDDVRARLADGAVKVRIHLPVVPVAEAEIKVYGWRKAVVDANIGVVFVDGPGAGGNE